MRIESLVAVMFHPPCILSDHGRMKTTALIQLPQQAAQTEVGLNIKHPLPLLPKRWKQHAFSMRLPDQWEEVLKYASQLDAAQRLHLAATTQVDLPQLSDLVAVYKDTQWGQHRRNSEVA